jgi:type II secretory pathway predicted ATPase ExeA
VFFGLQKEPFSQEIRVEDMLQSKTLLGVKERFLYAVNISAVALITGDIGSGKSCALRFAAAALHPSEYVILYVTATSGSIIELYKQICYALKIETKCASKAILTRIIRSSLLDLIGKKQKPVLIVDEASLLRLEVFTELHTITQFSLDAKAVLPIILAGQNNLLDNLMFRQSKALASRVVGRAHMEALKNNETEAYLHHHLTVAGSERNLFADAAITAIYQGSGGLLRRTNNLARGALIAAAADKQTLVSAEHVRLASTEII